MLTMKGVTAPEYINSWRAIHSETLISLSFYTIISAECLVGLLAIIGIVLMLKNFFGCNEVFYKQQAWARAACALGVLVWGVGFYALGGDFFLSWKTALPAVQGVQVCGLNNLLLLAVAYLFLKINEKSLTI
jgi:predicted small integral membrane protein